jgi:hypothetical protein
MKETISIIADWIAIGTFIVTGINLLILHKLRYRIVQKKHVPRVIKQIEEHNSSVIKLLPGANDKKNEIQFSMGFLKSTINELSKSTNIKNKIRLLKIKWLIKKYEIANIFHYPITDSKIRSIHLSITLFLYSYGMEIKRERIQGELNG